MSLLHQLGNDIKTFKINSKTKPYRASYVPGTILAAFHTFTHLAPSQKTQSWTVKWQKPILLRNYCRRVEKASVENQA